jgi:hypothetical protein
LNQKPENNKYHIISGTSGQYQGVNRKTPAKFKALARLKRCTEKGEI